MTIRAHPWLRCYQPRSLPRLRLVCLPHAGGGAGTYRSWCALLPESMELVAVQYPGREDRFGDPLIDDMTVLTQHICDALEPLTDVPYALFGHSMGSAVAYEVAQRMRSRGHPEPQRLLVSGRQAPGDVVGGAVHLGDENALCAELVRLGGTQSEVLADPDLRSVVLGYVRNDYRLIERYDPPPWPPLSCPVSVFVGRDDPELTVEQARRWSRTTRGRTDTQTFPGDHFYLTAHRQPVVAAVLRRLDPTSQPHPRAWPSTP